MVRQYVGAGKKVFEFLKPKPKVNKTKLDEANSNLAKAIQKGKATSAKLKQTQFEIKNPEFKGKDFTFAKTNKKTESNKEAYKRIQGENTKAIKSMIDDAFKEKKAKGGRVGLKRGTGLMKKKSNVQKIKETFGPKQKPQSRMTGKKKFPDLTGDGKVTFADILKGRGVINGKKKKKVI